MKKLSEYLLILLILVTTLGLEVKAQLEQLPLYSGAAGQNLQNLGLDTTNIDLVKQLADSADRIGILPLVFSWHNTTIHCRQRH